MNEKNNNAVTVNLFQIGLYCVHAAVLVEEEEEEL